ncbi:MAG TPA: DUF1080 domain-containing protein [Lacipirellulaceae bacterium]|jgi:hypothetical protein|nr:DUF1080 domain-containing protein [Lacipirellulaceae bacterium]
MYRTLLFTCIALFITSSPASAKEPKELFNGKDLTGWDGDSRVWSVEDGAIVGHTKDVPLKNNTFLIWKGGDVKDFKLTLKFKLEGGNSGIQYRSKVIDPEQWIVGGYQADMDGDNKYTGILYEERGRGILAKRGEKLTIGNDGKKTEESFGDADELAKSIHKDDWNEYVVEARGFHFKHSINGKLMSETIDHEKEHRADSGVLALQVHANLPAPMTVHFRDIKLEELEPRAAKEKSKADKK